MVSDQLKLVQLKVEVPGGSTLNLYLGVEVQAPEALVTRREYRCSSSGVIMQDPVFFEGRFYERKELERLHLQGLIAHEGGVSCMAATQLREWIQAYLKEELEKLRLKHGKLTQDELKAAVEYLAALVDEDSSVIAGLLSSGLSSDELDMLLAFIQTHFGISPELKEKLKEDCPLAALRLLRSQLLPEPSQLLTAEFIEYAGQCPALPELIEVASELILSLPKAQQVKLIDSLESRQDLKIKERDSLILLRLKASLLNVQRSDSADSDQLRILRHTVESLKGEVEALKFNSGGNQATFELFARGMRQPQDALMSDKLNSLEELREMREGHEALLREVKELKRCSANLESVFIAVEDSRREMMEIAERLKRLEVHSTELKGEMQDFKEHFTRTEEAIKADINTMRHSLANSSLPELASIEALVAQQTIPIKAISPTELHLAGGDQPFHIFCSYDVNTSDLLWIDMETGEEGTTALPDYTFQYYSSVCEGPDNLLFITGGSVRKEEVVSVQRDSFVLNNCTSMLNPRHAHGSAYFRGWLYVIGGSGIKLCERYDLQQQTWTAIPSLPTAASQYISMGVVVSCDKLYCLGG